MKKKLWGYDGGLPMSGTGVLHILLSLNNWRDDSLSKVLAVQTQGPEFRHQSPSKKAEHGSAYPRTREGRLEGLWTAQSI